MVTNPYERNSLERNLKQFREIPKNTKAGLTINQHLSKCNVLILQISKIQNEIFNEKFFSTAQIYGFHIWSGKKVRTRWSMTTDIKVINAKTIILFLDQYFLSSLEIYTSFPRMNWPSFANSKVYIHNYFFPDEIQS